MKILMFFGEIPIKFGGKKAGGAARVAWELSKKLSINNDVYLYPLHDFSNENRIENISIITREKKKIIFNTFPNIKTIQNYYYFFKKYNFDNFLSARFALSNSIMEKFIKKHIDKIKPDIIHIHEISAERMFAINLAMNMKVPLIVTSHGVKSDIYEYIDTSIPKDLNNRKQFENDIFNRIISKNNGYITAVSSDIKNKIINYYNVPENKIQVILNGISSDFINTNMIKKSTLRKKYNLPDDKIIFLTVGTLSKRKNQLLVLKSLLEMDENIRSKILYILVGDGDEKEFLVNFIKENKLDKNVLFVGNKFSNELIEYYWLSDYFILTSLSEAMPLVFFEALAAGLPIITIKTLEGVSDIYNKNCFILSDDYKPISLKNAILNALNKNWNASYIINYSKNYTWNVIAEKYQKLYNKLRG